jgi:hypothetical protein
MMVVIVSSLWNEEILRCLVLKNRIEDISVFGGHLRTFLCMLNSVFKAIEAVDSRNNDNGLIILLNEVSPLLLMVAY